MRSGEPIQVQLLGSVKVIEYVKPNGRAVRRHEFGGGVQLLATADGKALIIKGGRMRVHRGEVHN